MSLCAVRDRSVGSCRTLGVFLPAYYNVAVVCSPLLPLRLLRLREAKEERGGAAARISYSCELRHTEYGVNALAVDWTAAILDYALCTAKTVPSNPSG